MAGESSVDVPWWLAAGESSAAPRCLAFAARILGKELPYSRIAAGFPQSSRLISLDDVEAAAGRIGLYPMRYRGEPAKLGFSPYPVLLPCRAGERVVYRVIYGRTADGQRLRAFEAPARLRELDHRYFGHSYRGEALILAAEPVSDVEAALRPPWTQWHRVGSWLGVALTIGGLLGIHYWRRG